MENKIGESIRRELKKQPEEKTTFQIRLFDDGTGACFYKQLTQKELMQIISVLGKIQWT